MTGESDCKHEWIYLGSGTKSGERKRYYDYLCKKCKKYETRDEKSD